MMLSEASALTRTPSSSWRNNSSIFCLVFDVQSSAVSMENENCINDLDWVHHEWDGAACDIKLIDDNLTRTIFKVCVCVPPPMIFN